MDRIDSPRGFEKIVRFDPSTVIGRNGSTVLHFRWELSALQMFTNQIGQQIDGVTTPYSLTLRREDS